MPESDAQPDFRSAFESSPGAYLLLAPDLTIIGVSDAYLRATMTQRDTIVGRGLFEVFPDNPDDPEATGERNLRASLERVLQHRRPDVMAIQKYDIRRPSSEGGGFEVRYWSPQNLPVFASDGGVQYIIHHVEDVTAMVRLEERNATSTDSLRRASEIIETAQEAFVSMDEAGVVNGWNRAAEELFGWRKEEIMGHDLAQAIIPAELRDAHRSGLRRFLATGEGAVMGKRLELPALHRNGDLFPVEITISAVQVADGYLFHAFLHSIVDRKADEQRLRDSAQELRRLNEELRKADALKSRFLSIAAHELRTPLTAISGFTSTMLNMWETLPLEEKHKFIEIVDSQGARLTRLVDDLLTLSKIDSGVLSANASPVDVGVAIKSTIRELAVEHISVDCPADTIALVGADHLEQILVNYISNAIKYGADPITVAAAEEDGAVHISVSDSGDGVPEDVSGRLFEQFSRSRFAATQQGTGLGLSIVAGLAEVYGGRAWYEPHEPHGASFHVRLPAAS